MNKPENNSWEDYCLKMIYEFSAAYSSELSLDNFFLARMNRNFEVLCLLSDSTVDVHYNTEIETALLFSA